MKFKKKTPKKSKKRKNIKKTKLLENSYLKSIVSFDFFLAPSSHSCGGGCGIERL